MAPAAFSAVPFDPSAVDPSTATRVRTVSARALVVGGKLRANLTGPTGSAVWLVRRLVVVSSGSSRLFLYRTTQPNAATLPDAELVDGSTAGSFDVSEYPLPGLFVDTGYSLAAVWSDLASGSATITCDYVEQV